MIDSCVKVSKSSQNNEVWPHCRELSLLSTYMSESFQMNDKYVWGGPETKFLCSTLLYLLAVGTMPCISFSKLDKQIISDNEYMATITKAVHFTLHFIGIFLSKLNLKRMQFQNISEKSKSTGRQC